ncbi:hypothetical protein [Synoicihabitans lomoniglobus]|uniref:Holin n=1 Tax=Synoicihabitans lomoniglobus TaxID=2909285 RepID=A0AAF0CRT9_9BACT|nr:hypothetical protein [Opitutaceae bacterium LMO-M01]WED66844.1 hypothetical protein PXH66_08275 [Opitutaceae bacterium LMO-M01]
MTDIIKTSLGIGGTALAATTGQFLSDHAATAAGWATAAFMVVALLEKLGALPGQKNRKTK